MSASRLGSRDVVATVVTGVAATYYGLHRAGIHVTGISSTRAVAAVVFMLGLIGCAAGAAAAASRAGVGTSSSATALSLLGGAALVTGVVAIALGSQSWLTALVVLLVALWAGATLHHLLTAPPDDDLAARRPATTRAGRP